LNLSKTSVISKYLEQLNWSNAFNIAWSDGTICTTVPLDGLTILNETKYLIIKLLIKIKTSTISTYAIPCDLNMYKTIKLEYTINSLEEETLCNTIDEINNIVSNKDVSFYKLYRGIDL
jgi:hypothetical protein